MIEGTTATQAASTSLYAGSTPAAAPKQGMDQETFLTLLVAQLRNQDPSSPMDTSEMMAQSTQLASMEQLTAMADTTRESFALQMRIAATGPGRPAGQLRRLRRRPPDRRRHRCLLRRQHPDGRRRRRRGAARLGVGHRHGPCRGPADSSSDSSAGSSSDSSQTSSTPAA